MTQHAATPWQSLREGNQYIKAAYLPTAKLVGASVIPQLVRPWNPYALIARGFTPRDYETTRFLDADADFIVRACNAHEELVAFVQEVYGEAQSVRFTERALSGQRRILRYTKAEETTAVTTAMGRDHSIRGAAFQVMAKSTKGTRP